MAWLEITFKIMPQGPDADLKKIALAAKKEIELFGGIIRSETTEPVAFGIKAILITFSLNETKGTTDPLEEKLTNIPEVNRVDISHITRALG